MKRKIQFFEIINLSDWKQLKQIKREKKTLCGFLPEIEIYGFFFKVDLMRNFKYLKTVFFVALSSEHIHIDILYSYLFFKNNMHIVSKLLLLLLTAILM